MNLFLFLGTFFLVASKNSVFAISDNQPDRPCGTDYLPFLKDTDSQQNLSITITGSREAKRNEWPWAVSLGTLQRDFKYSHRCGGVLLNEQWILTSARCLDFEFTDEFVAVVGAHNISLQAQGEPGKETINIGTAIRHPDYRANARFKTAEHDIALLQLTEPLKMTPEQPYTWKVCLPSSAPANSTDNPYINKTGTIVGWGERRPDFAVMTDVPYVTDLSVFKCDIGVRDWVACINGRFQSFCTGDVGGPMMVKVDGRWTVVAVASSHDEGCAEEGDIGLLTR